MIATSKLALAGAITAALVLGGCGVQEDVTPQGAAAGATISALRTSLPAGAKSAFYDEETRSLWILTLRAADRKVELSTLDPASNNLRLVARSAAIANDWAGGYFARSGGDLFVAWGRHIWRFGAGVGGPVDIALQAADVSSVSDQPGGIVVLQASSGGLLVVAVTGLSEFITFDPKTSGWARMPSGLTSTSSGAFSLAADGGVVAVGSSDSSPDLTVRRVAPGGSYSDEPLSTGPTLLKARNDGAIASLTGKGLTLIGSNGVVSEDEFQTYTRTALPIALGSSDRYAWVARIADPQKEGTLELAQVELASGVLRTVSFPVEVRDGGRQGLANRPANKSTYIDPGITSIAVTDAGKAYVLTQCGVSANGSECLYSAAYVVG